MDEWLIIFEQVQKITRNTQSLEESIAQVVAFARNNPTVFDEQDYWNQAQNHGFQAAFATLTDWAKQGLSSLDPKAGWQFLVLDLGDCPETFRLYSPGGQSLMSESQFHNILLSKRIISGADMEGCFGPDIFDPFSQLFGEEKTELSDHHVSKLDDILLDWTASGETNFHGMSGYLLWLTLGSLALVEALRDTPYCESILQGRDKLYLLSGYEEIFFYAATVTPEGILHETV